MSAVFFFGLSFLIGAIPTAYLAGKYFAKIDIRQHGSGNVGATNALRVLGKKVGAAVFFVDFLKGYLPAFFFSSLSHLEIPRGEAALWAGLSAILGHIFSPFLNFRGGKGIATGGGAVCAAFPFLFFLTLAVWSLVFAISRIVSLSSLCCLIALVLLSVFFQSNPSVTWIFGLYSVIAIWTHRENLIRLFLGEEKRLS